MSGPGSVKLRMIVDFVLCVVFGFAVPPLLGRLPRSSGLREMWWVFLLLAIGFLCDGLRTWGRAYQQSSIDDL
jgi:hypothetical protein